MDTWLVKCDACGFEAKVVASSEYEAIAKAKEEHEAEMGSRTQHRCDFGPLMQAAFNLNNPEHPAAPRGW